MITAELSIRKKKIGACAHVCMHLVATLSFSQIHLGDKTAS